MQELESLKVAFDDLDSDYIDLQQENKRYREALVEIINARNHLYPTEYVFGVEGIARKALEEESK